MLMTALVYGAVSGVIIILSMIAGFTLMENHGGASQIVGYLIMLVALSVIFIAVKRHRDKAFGGVIKFGAAFALGLSIAAVAGVAYVATWEVYLAITDYAFIGEYTAGIIEAKREAGVSGAELDKTIADMNRMVEAYGNPLFRLPMTFLEIFPVGLVIALVSAAILRNPGVLPARG